MGRADQTTKRTDSIRVRLSPEMMKRLERIASELGMPISTMAALAVGEYVIEKERTILVERTLMPDGSVLSSKKTPLG